MVAPVLPQSFILLPGIGHKTETRIWTRGIRDWDHYRAWVRGPKRDLHCAILADAATALREDDPSFFARRLRTAEHWRCIGDWGAGALAVDIETHPDTGVTVVGVHGPRDLVEPVGPYDRDLGDTATRILVRGVDLTPQTLTKVLAPARMLLTFNGGSFDLPIIQKYGATVPRVPHCDLMVPLRRAGYKGGLKRIEEAVGLARPEEVRGMSGYDAVILWRQHELGDKEALPKLALYNGMDVENLPLLARIAYERLREDVLPETLDASLDGWADETDLVTPWRLG